MVFPLVRFARRASNMLLVATLDSEGGVRGAAATIANGLDRNYSSCEVCVARSENKFRTLYHDECIVMI